MTREPMTDERTLAVRLADCVAFLDEPMAADMLAALSDLGYSVVLRTAIERLPRFSIDVENVERPLTPSARGLLVRIDDVRAALSEPVR